MRKILFFNFLLLMINLSAQNQIIDWIEKIDSNPNNLLFGAKIYQSKLTKDYYFNFYSHDVSETDNDLFEYSTINSFNSYGNLLWNKKNENQLILDFILFEDNLFTLSHLSHSNSKKNQFELQKFDLKGNNEQRHKFKLSNNILLSHLIPINNNDFLIGGNKEYNNIAKVILTNFNAKGKKIWEKEYGSTGQNYISSIITTTDGYILVAGFEKSIQNHLSNLWILKLSYDGTIIWEKVLPNLVDTRSDLKILVEEVDNKGFVLLTPSNKGEARVMKFDGNGNEKWNKLIEGKYNSSNFISSGIYYVDNKIILGGIFDSLNESEVSIFELDLNGIVHSNFILSDLNNNSLDYYSDMLFYPIEDRGYIVLGKKESGEINLIKTHASNNISQSKEKISISPNPAKDFIKISSLEGKNIISIKNLNGNEIIRKETNLKEEILNISSLPKGIYFVNILGDSKYDSYKLIKQ